MDELRLHGLIGGGTKRNGDNAALSSEVAGTTLKLVPPKGTYDGVTSKVTITDSDYLASNIRKNVGLFGLFGTLVENELFGVNPDIAFASGFSLTGIDKNYRYMSQGGQSSPTQAKYNHAGTLISNIRPADVPQAYYYATSHFSEGFTYHYNTAVRIYDAVGTLIRAITLAYAPPYSGTNFGYNGDKIVLQEDGANEKVRYFNALGTYLGLLTLPVGYSSAFLTNPNKTIVVKYNGGNTARLYCKVGGIPVNINTNAEMYEYLKMSI